MTESTEHDHHAGLWTVSGDGVLARMGDLVLLSSVESGRLVDALLDLHENSARSGDDGRRFTEAVAAAVESGTDPAGGASVLAFGPAGAGLSLMVSGAAWADVTTDHGTQRIEAGHPGAVLRCLLRAPVTAVRAGLGAAGGDRVQTDRFSRLDAGTVRAGGLSYYAAGRIPDGLTAPVPAAEAPAEPGPPYIPQADLPEQAIVLPQEQIPSENPPPPGPEPVAVDFVAPEDREPAASVNEGGSFEATEFWTPDFEQGGQAALAEPEATPPGASGHATEMWSGPSVQSPAGPRDEMTMQPDEGAGGAGQAPGGPVIQGVYCPAGHFNDPAALYCAVCGVSMTQQTLAPMPGTRPPLGVLVLDDGSAFSLDHDYVVGREPGLDASVASGEALPLRVADDTGTVSRVHARVILDGWRVLITDLGSANGTRVRFPGDESEFVLQPQVPTLLTAGSLVDLGGRAFRFESPHP